MTKVDLYRQVEEFEDGRNRPYSKEAMSFILMIEDKPHRFAQYWNEAVGPLRELVKDLTEVAECLQDMQAMPSEEFDKHADEVIARAKKELEESAE